MERLLDVDRVDESGWWQLRLELFGIEGGGWTP